MTEKFQGRGGLREVLWHLATLHTPGWGRRRVANWKSLLITPAGPRRCKSSAAKLSQQRWWQKAPCWSIWVANSYHNHFSFMTKQKTLKSTKLLQDRQMPLYSLLLLASCKERIMNELLLPTNEKRLPSVALHYLRKYCCIFTQWKRGINYFLSAVITCAIAVGLDVWVYMCGCRKTAVHTKGKSNFYLLTDKNLSEFSQSQLVSA